MYLVEGEPGTGKTTLALQFLLTGRDLGEKTLYVTLSETAVELHAVAASHGWSLDGVEVLPLTASESWKVEDQYTLYHPSEIELGETIKMLVDPIERLGPTRVVIDSLSELKLLAREPLRYRRQILALKQFFAGRDCTVLLIDDHSAEDAQLESLAHGVVRLEHLPFDYGRARRRIRVVKLRGVAVMEGFHDFVIQRGGLEIFPRLTAGAYGGAPAAFDVIKSGIGELDTLVGGGLSGGTATVLIGPAGTGKSTLTAQYAATAGRSGHRAAFFLFDERPATFLARCDALGMEMSGHVAAGMVSIQQTDPGELSPGEFSYRVCAAVENGARVICIDSLNGYLNAIPQSDSPLVRMHELLGYLGERGVSTLLVVAQHGIVGTGMSAPIDVSYLADCVLLFRFFEAHGSVRRALSVVKKRTGYHETSIRELKFGQGGVQVGGALSDFQGVLTGVPQFVGMSDPLLAADDK
jgi:circadian clock protein KaiC